jgi:hypothetical protein
MVLNGDAAIVVAPGGSFKFGAPATLYAGIAGGGRILNAGRMDVEVGRGAVLSLRVPVLNRGLLSVQEGSVLQLESRLQQDAPAALLFVDSASRIDKGDEGFLQIDAGQLQSQGTLNAAVQLGDGATLVHGGSTPTVINGDVVLSPLASLSSRCSGSVGCTALKSNGTVWLNGLANVTLDDGSNSVEIVQAQGQIIGAFAHAM